MPSCTTLVSREQLGDYGHFDVSDSFYCEGNIFDDSISRSSDANISPKQHRIDDQQGYNRDNGPVTAGRQAGSIEQLLRGTTVTLNKPTGLSLPTNDHVNSILVFLSARLTNRYLVTRVIQCDGFIEGWQRSGELRCTELCLIAELGTK